MQNLLKISVAVFLALIIFSVGLIAGYFAKEYIIYDQPPQTAADDLALYWEVWNILSNRFVNEDSVDEQGMFYDSIKGMVSALGDPHTIYLDPEETASFNDSSAG